MPSPSSSVSALSPMPSPSVSNASATLSGKTSASSPTKSPSMSLHSVGSRGKASDTSGTPSSSSSTSSGLAVPSPSVSPAKLPRCSARLCLRSARSRAGRSAASRRYASPGPKLSAPPGAPSKRSFAPSPSTSPIGATMLPKRSVERAPRTRQECLRASAPVGSTKPSRSSTPSAAASFAPDISHTVPNPHGRAVMTTGWPSPYSSSASQ